MTERGICWSTSHNPTTSGSHANSGTGTGSFSVNMTSLTANTIYYVRAYAINSAGTAYGSEVSFTTSDIPNYTIAVSANPSSGGTVGGGGTYQQGQSCTVTASANTGYTFLRWTENGSQVSTNANYTFTVSGNRTLVAQFQAQSYTISVTANPSNGGTVSGGGSYNYGQSCTVVASANSGYEFTNWTEGGSVVSNNASYSFTVSGNRTLVANFEAVPTYPIGAINGLFSVSATKQVYFSQDNLQYQASSNMWRFASSQYNYIGSANSNVSINYSGWIDLFGWGTSGWNNGNVYYQPYDYNNSGTNNNGYGYGPTDGTNYNNNLIDEYVNADWGMYNAIINGGNQNNQWRVLTHDEWTYLSFTRQDAALKKGMATVASVKGIIILPDEWTLPEGLSFSNNTNYSSSVNVYSLSEWALMEEAGAVFLPAGGLRSGTQVNNAGSYGHYWSSICQGLAYGYTVYIAPPAGGFNHNLVGDYRRRDLGCSVRLVQDFNP